ncbi:MAG: hydroxymethylbilane synthase [Actinomycetota bacterium]
MTNRSRVLRLATRSSLQARTQAQFVADSIRAHQPGTEVELVFVDTTGDQRADVPLHQIGGQGVFVKEVQQAVLDGRADAAVHSAKDLPSENVGGLTIAAFTARRSPHDALIGRSLDELALGATVATGSVRRRAQIAALRPDLSFVELRGNIPTRLDKVPADGAIVMAVAALEVLGLTDRIAQVLDIELCVPMVGQGCVAVEARTDDAVVRDALRPIDHSATRRAVEAERAFLAELGAGCSLPVAAHLDAQGVFHAFMARDGDVVQLAGSIGASDDHKVVGAGIAHECRRRLRAR